ncbi:recombinase family protein [uncultured Vagococcus sp.]|uniref:recombinase family protein n=1 Tax=uncultured Vagococcus sp. TaxID=189676 RepID=UPI0028D1EB84|nr:recombinase family protein [uncultured Vagococcus sp.]
MVRYGYVREGYPIKEVIQLQEVLKCNCEEVIIESGETTTYKKLTGLMSRMSAGDKIIMYNLQVFGTGLKKLKVFLLYLEQHGLHLQSIKDDVDTEVDHQFFKVCQLILNTDEKNASYCIRKSLDKARSMGKEIGRPTIDAEIVKEIQHLFVHERQSLRSIADKCQVSLGTVHKYTRLTKQVDSRIRG